MEIFKSTEIYCDKGDIEAIIMSDGKSGYCSSVCAACSFYTDMQLDIHSEGTSIEKGKTVERLGQTIEDSPYGPVIVDCTPLSEEVAQDIDPEYIKSLSAFFKQLPNLMFPEDKNDLLES